MYKTGIRPPKKFNVDKLCNKEVWKELEARMGETKEELESNTNILKYREALRKAAFDATEEVLGRPSRKLRDWFRKNGEDLDKLLKKGIELESSSYIETLD